MPFIPAPNCVKLEAIYNHIGQLCENVHFLEFDHEPVLEDLEACALAYVNWFDSNLQPLVSNGTSLILIRARDMTVDSGLAIEYDTGLPLSGTAGNANPGNVTAAVKWSSGLAGRSFRGRTFVIGIPQGAMTGNANVLDSDYADDLDTAFELLIDAFNLTDGQFVVASFFHDNAPRTNAVTTPITASSVNRDVDSQRRRLAGRGS